MSWGNPDISLLGAGGEPPPESWRRITTPEMEEEASVAEMLQSELELARKEIVTLRTEVDELRQRIERIEDYLK